MGNPTWWYLAPKGPRGNVRSMWFHIPSNVNCPGDRCTVQFTWKTANSCNPHPAAYCNYYHDVVGPQTRGATTIIVVASAIITATRQTIATQPWVIDCVAAKCSRIVLKSSSWEKASLHRPRLRPHPLQLLMLLPRLLPAHLLPHRLRLQLHQAVV